MFYRYEGFSFLKLSETHVLKVGGSFAKLSVYLLIAKLSVQIKFFWGF